MFLLKLLYSYSYNFVFSHEMHLCNLQSHPSCIKQKIILLIEGRIVCYARVSAFPLSALFLFSFIVVWFAIQQLVNFTVS